MENSFYVPIVKSKDGEFTALSKLDSFTKSHIFPLIEITPLEFDHESNQKPKSLEEHLYNFCEKRFLKKWATKDCMIDTHHIGGELINGLSAFEYIYQKIVNEVVIPEVPVPVVRFKMSDSAIVGLQNVIKQYNILEFAIRVRLADVMSPSLSADIETLCTQFDITVENCHIVYDLADANYDEMDNFIEPVLYTIESFPFLKRWKSFTLTGGAFPPSHVLKKGETTVLRNDWKFYQKIIEKLKEADYYRHINYGDYGVVHPGYFEFNPKTMSTSANIRYAIKNAWFVIKGSKVSKTNGNAQYKDQAKEISKKEFFFGEEFSSGDQYLKHCGLGRLSPGRATTWNWVGNNHHFTLVVKDLFANSAAA